MLSAEVIGNLGNDPEMKYGQNGSGRLQFNVAVNQRQRVEGEWTEKTEWVRCTVFGQRAESLSSMLRKGSRVYVRGRLEARPWTSQQGEVRAGLELIADTVEFMSAKRDDGEQPAADWKPIQAPAKQQRRPSTEPTGYDGELMDLPF